jgi:hypothetical protein
MAATGETCSLADRDCIPLREQRTAHGAAQVAWTEAEETAASAAP